MSKWSTIFQKIGDILDNKNLDLREFDRAAWPLGLLIFSVGSAIAFISTTYRYLTPLSGVNGTPGAMLVMISELVLITISIFLLFPRKNAKPKKTICFLAIIAILSLIAELFLHGWISAVALIIAFVGLLIYSRKNA